MEAASKTDKGNAELRTQNSERRTLNPELTTVKIVMKLYEFEGKSLFRKTGIPVPIGEVAADPGEARAIAEELGLPKHKKLMKHKFKKWRGNRNGQNPGDQE